jgi:hypothetical protein
MKKPPAGQAAPPAFGWMNHQKGGKVAENLALDQARSAQKTVLSDSKNPRKRLHHVLLGQFDRPRQLLAPG